MRLIPVFHVLGYGGPDPLDRLGPRLRFGLPALVSALVAVMLVQVITRFALVEYHPPWARWLEPVVYGLFAVMMVAIRKASSLIPFLLLLAPRFAIELYLESHHRQQGRPSLWDYPAGTFLASLEPAPLRFLIAGGFDALLFGPVCLFLARVTAAALRRPLPEEDKAEEPLFPSEWTDEPVPRPERGAQFWILRILGLAYFGYLALLVLGALGPAGWPAPLQALFDMTYANPYLAVNTVAKIGLMAALATVGAFNENLRAPATLGLLGGHAVSTASSILFFALAGPGGPHREFLLTSAIVDALMAVVFLWIHGQAGSARPPLREVLPNLFSLPVLIWRRWLGVVAVVSATVATAALLIRLTGRGPASLVAAVSYPDPTLGNALTLHLTLALLAAIMLRRQDLREPLGVIVAFAAGLGLVFGVGLLLGGPVAVRQAGAAPLPIQGLYLLQLGELGLLAAGLAIIANVYYDVEYGITTLRAASACAVRALHAALFGSDDCSDVLGAIDRYAGTIRGRKRGLLNFPFWLLEHLLPPLLGLRPPFSTMSRQEQKHLLRYRLVRLEHERRRAFFPELADLAHTLAVAAHSIVLLATYAGPAGRAITGYVPPGARRRLQAGAPGRPPDAQPADLPRDENDPLNEAHPPPRRVAPRVSTPVGEPELFDEVDYAIVGSGPGGAVMAYRLATERADARILVLERGGRYSPLEDFNERELEMIAKLYKEGGLQQTKRAGMFVVQAECVGGGSVVNNAVCVRMPREVRDEWEARYDLRLAGLDAAYDQIRTELKIAPLAPTAINRNVESLFEQAVAGFNRRFPDRPLEVPRALEVNAPGALGDGLWNLGNKYLAKRTVLETYVPWAEARGVRFGPGVTAVSFSLDGKRADSVLVRTVGGGLRRIRIKRALIVSCGAIASSHFLMRSGIPGPVGLRLACNFAVPVSLELDRNVDLFDGEQIAIGAVGVDPQRRARALFETYGNPPGSFALTVPFFFDRHARIMRSYRRLINFGALVGSEAGGRVQRRADPLSGQAFTWTLDDADRRNLRYAIETLAWLAWEAGAARAVFPTRPGVELSFEENRRGGSSRAPEIEAFARCLARRDLRMSDLLMSTAHPQGGNAMMGARAAAEVAAEAVVDESFRVKPLSNVYVADASIFPESIGVNPQWTIMALSSLASRSVLSRA